MNEELFNRYNLDKVQSLISSEGPEIVLIKGLPGVGKSYTAKAVSRNVFKTIYLVNLKEDKKKFLLPLKFIDSPNDFISALELTYRQKFVPGKSVLLIKDVTLIKDLWSSLKSLSHKIRGLKIIATASSLDFSITGEDEVELKPLSFFEFLEAVGKRDVATKIKESFERGESLEENYFSLTNFLYSQFLIVGGMPGAIQSFNKTHLLPKVEGIKASVLDDLKNKLSLVDDTGKYRLADTFENILPSLLSPSRLFVSSSVFHKRSDMNATRTINMLVDSGSVVISRQTKELNLSMPLSAKKNKYKLYYPDAGLLVSSLISNGIYKKDAIFDELLNINQSESSSFICENAVATSLSRNHPDLYFYAWFDKMNHRSCIDFLYFSESKNIAKRKIVPVMYLPPNSKSITQFKEVVRKNKSKLTSACVLYSGNVKTIDDISYLPYFMAELL